MCVLGGDQGWGTQHACITRIQSPLLDNNNNRRRDVFCGEEEVRNGRLKREEEGKKKWQRDMEKFKGGVNTEKDEKQRKRGRVMG